MSLSPENRQRVIYDWNQTQQDFSSSLVLHHLFENQVKLSPNKLCAKFGAQLFSSAELNRYANQLANYLIAKGIGKGHIVGIHLDRSFELLIALLAVLKAGAAFAPLDSKLPPRRTQLMIADLNCPVTLTSKKLSLNQSDISYNVVDIEDWEYSQESDLDPGVDIRPADNAYAIFTSGTTGLPKAAIITHGGICNFLEWLQQKYKLTETDKVLQKANISFDVSIWELFWPLITDAQLVFCAPRREADAESLVKTVRDEGITILGFTSSMLARFIEEPGVDSCVALRWVNFGGDALSVALQNRFFDVLPNCLLHDLYGPAEAAIVTLYWECSRDSKLPFVPIGKPLANTKVYLLDEQLDPVDIGAIGEIHLSGIQVATGYHNRADLTAQKFIANPFETSYPYDRLYRTGDLGRFLPSGDIEFLGRKDSQVKINGVRIELGEIDSIIGRYSCFNQICVRALPNQRNELRLVVYYVTAQNEEVIERTKRLLMDELPISSFPSAFVRLNNFPLTTNGKIDVERLPSPFLVETEICNENFTKTELMLKHLWSEASGITISKATDNLFYLGGSSLEFVNFIAAIENKFNVNLLLEEIIADPTIYAISTYLAHLEIADHA